MFEPLECDCKVGAPLVACECVDLVDDHGVDGLQDRPRLRRGHHQVQRFGGGDHERGRAAHHRRSFGSGRVTSADPDREVGRSEAHAGGNLRYLRQRSLEVLRDVHGQGLEGRDVCDPGPGGAPAREMVQVEPVDAHQEPGEGLAGAGGSCDQRGPAGCHLRPTLPLRCGGAVREGGLEPTRDGGMEGHCIDDVVAQGHAGLPRGIEQSRHIGSGFGT